MSYVFAPPKPVSVPICGKEERFPVHRIYCLARNHADHAQEMGFTGHEEPFFFLKPADAESLVVVEAGSIGTIRYPSLTQQHYHEIELVVAIGAAGQDIAIANAHKYIYGYAVGLDMTRMDLLKDMSTKGRAWCLGKGFDDSAVIGPITPADQVTQLENAEIHLRVNNEERQRSRVSRLLWNAEKIIEQLSRGWTLRPGDLIYTGTPKGVAAVVRGDVMVGGITGLPELKVRVL